MARSSEESKARILRAARAEFGRRGYQGATVRAIASEAQIDPSMVMRYFHSKAGLFDAVCAIDLQIPRLADLPRETLGEALVRHFLARWEGDPSDDTLLVLLRAAAADANARRQLLGLFGGQLMPALAEVIADAEEIAPRTGLISSQLLGMALTRHVLDLPPMTAMSHEDLVRRIGPTIQRYLTGPLAG